MDRPIGAPVTVEEANEYITTHIQMYYETGHYPVKSFIFDAAMLRDYLNENPNIENMKLMLAVRPDVAGQNTSSMILVGYDAQGNYIRTADNMVLAHAGACPYACPAVGPAQHDHII